VGKTGEVHRTSARQQERKITTLLLRSAGGSPGFWPWIQDFFLLCICGALSDILNFPPSDKNSGPSWAIGLTTRCLGRRGGEGHSFPWTITSLSPQDFLLDRGQRDNGVYCRVLAEGLRA